ncbi:MAG TPA: hypothetical protein VK759_03305 [Rhizomicrobium sp.]|nr:hypothetical protein [Rhizomicrobium sp.]
MPGIVGGTRGKLEWREIVWNIDARDTAGLEKTAREANKRNRVRDVLEDVVHVNNVEMADRSRTFRVEKSFNDVNTKFACMRSGLARRFNARDIPAACLRGFQEKTRTGPYVEERAPRRFQDSLENLQPVRLRKLGPCLVFGGVIQECGLFFGIIIFAVGLFERTGIRQWYGVTKSASATVQNVVSFDMSQERPGMLLPFDCFS